MPGPYPHHANGNPSAISRLVPPLTAARPVREDRICYGRGHPALGAPWEGSVRRLGFGLAGTVGMLVAVIFVSAASAAVPTVACANRVNNTHAKLQGCVARRRTRAPVGTQEIADDNNDALVGHLATALVDYAQGVLEAAGYLVTPGVRLSVHGRKSGSSCASVRFREHSSTESTFCATASTRDAGGNGDRHAGAG